MRVMDVLSLKSFTAPLLSQGLVDLTPPNLDTSRLACKAPHADVNAQGGYYGSALLAASVNGHAKVVQMLMDAGADVNAQGG
jgi:hypothetical protein